jgi:hypothetical protein
MPGIYKTTTAFIIFASQENGKEKKNKTTLHFP